ncbi:MAG: alpha/beta hydrolase family protein [Limnochordia bacterium]
MRLRRTPSRKKRITRIAFLGVLTLAILFAALSMIGIKLIYSEQFGRFERPDRATTADMHHSDLAELYPQELVNFYSGPNRLQGYLYHNPLSPGLVVVVHGLGGGADSYLPQIKYFLDQGWSVFAYDATGSYDSEGDGTRGFPQAVLDLDAALQFVASRADLKNLPVLLFGHSWGGYATANILHFDHEIAGIVSIAAPNSSMEIILEQGSQMLGSIMYTQRPFIWLYERLLFGKAAELTALAGLNKTTIPALIVHGTGDKVVDFYGSGIINKREQFTNPNIQYLILDDEERNGHNNLLKSMESIAYANQLNAELRAISEQYDGEIPYEVKREFFAKVDKDLFHEVNRELMDTINNFFLNCL